jgi:CrcB protein
MPNSNRAEGRGVRDVDLIVVVAVGGVIGSLARGALDVFIGRISTSPWPWPTFLVNVIGSLCLGFVLVWLMARVPGGSRFDRWAKPFIVTGVLGGFTTFSAYSMQVRDLLASNQMLLATGYAIVSIVIAVAAVAIGAALARRRWPMRSNAGES